MDYTGHQHDEPLRRKAWKVPGGRPGAALTELLTAIDEGRVPGSEWRYHVTVYRFRGAFTGTRDSIAMALRDSAWMAASIADSGGLEDCALYRLWGQLRVADSTRRFDHVLADIRVLADISECWIQFVNPPAGYEHEGRTLTDAPTGQLDLDPSDPAALTEPPDIPRM